MKRSFLSLLPILLSVAVSGSLSCSPAGETISLMVGDVEYTVEVARTEEERKDGLMFRKKLEKQHGMLFVFPYDQKLSFWMRNTSLPLSIAFIGKDGSIKEIFDMTPHSERPVLSTYFVRFALEVNQGEFAELGIQPGDKVLLPDDL
jgi:uncharacterized membrane protein (UPF0127 family)